MKRRPFRDTFFAAGLSLFGSSTVESSQPHKPDLTSPVAATKITEQVPEQKIGLPKKEDSDPERSGIVEAEPGPSAEMPQQDEDVSEEHPSPDTVLDELLRDDLKSFDVYLEELSQGRYIVRGGDSEPVVNGMPKTEVHVAYHEEDGTYTVSTPNWPTQPINVTAESLAAVVQQKIEMEGLYRDEAEGKVKAEELRKILVETGELPPDMFSANTGK